ncbi:hypothetical protein [Lysinibacillus sp. FSL W8-0992]|uniref:hypothetical protein n=1 Tax=Lysinibacillus sp. FSL W8-0992 TaxID=2954643 RepID=UPI0030F9BE78
MQQQTHHTLKTVVQENNHSAYELSAQMVQLEVIQGAVARLLDRVDDIVHNGWSKDRGLAYMAIDEIRDTVRLIDIGFCPLTKSIGESIKGVNKTSDKLFELIVSKGSSDESGDAAAKPDMNSVEGCNYLTMENNVKIFIKEFGREPESFEEVLTYIQETVERVVNKKNENKKADALTSTHETYTR